MKKLLLVLVVLGVIGAIVLAGLAYADIRIRGLAEAEAAKHLGDAIPGAHGPSVRIESFPFVGRVLLGGSVPSLVVQLDSLESQGVEVERIVLEVDDLRIDRDALLDRKKLVVTSVDRARLEGRVSAEALDRFIDVPISISDSKVRVQVEGREYAGSINISKHAIVVVVDLLPPIIVPLPEEAYLPCEPEVEVKGDRIHLACTVSELPDALADVLAQESS